MELELTEPLPTIALEGPGGGAGLVLRRRGRLVGFLLAEPEERSGEAVLTPDRLASVIGREAADAVLEDALREELAPPVPPARTGREAERARNRGSEPDVTVAICTHDRPERLARCLEAVLELPLPADAEVLVVDNAPPDGRTRDVVAGRPRARYVREPRPGLDFARNAALAEARGELLAFLDDDVVAAAGWWDGLLRAWRTFPDAGAVTGLVLPLRLDTEARVEFERRGGFRRGFRRQRFGPSLPGNLLYPVAAGIFGAGCNMTFRTELLRRLGGFDEALDQGPPLPGGGDLDIFHRVIRAGETIVYEPTMAVYHEHRPTREGLRSQYRSWGQGFMAFVSKVRGRDPELRPLVRRTVAWWFLSHVRRVAGSLVGRGTLAPDFALAELAGGLRGWFGEYGRARARAAEIRRLHGERPE